MGAQPYGKTPGLAPEFIKRPGDQLGLQTERAWFQTRITWLAALYAEVHPYHANQVCDVVEAVFRVAAVVEQRDESLLSAQQLISVGVLEVPTF
ncbi:hypothetical protein [Paraburkholderia unamae]|uniref:Uncharacterized protein n=1 Tax=Paraburkholderia unamae TaxID=219649 RepID=A0ACC6RHT3_9BURK